MKRKWKWKRNKTNDSWIDNEFQANDRMVWCCRNRETVLQEHIQTQWTKKNENDLFLYAYILCFLMRFNFHERQPEINTRWTLSKWNENTVLQRIHFFDLNEAETKNITTKWFIRIHFQLINDCDRREWQFNECDTEKYHHLCWKFELCKIMNSKRLLPKQKECRYSFWPSMMTIRA